MTPVALILSLSSVIPGPGWSTPVAVTEEPVFYNQQNRLVRNEQGRFHLVYSGYGNTSRIGYTMFLTDGTKVFPDTMISRDVQSAYLSKPSILTDSLIAFWRETSPVYYAIRNMEDGSGVTPATYLFTTSTLRPFIRSSPDSLGRLHVMYNAGNDIYYEVWTPAPGSGFITEYGWQQEEASYGSVLLVDGNRVHVVMNNPNYLWYTQYDLEGNTVVPPAQFVSENLDANAFTIFPLLAVDAQRNLLVVEQVRWSPDHPYEFMLWKLNGATGDVMIGEKVLFTTIPGEYGPSPGTRILVPLPGSEAFYLLWQNSMNVKHLLNMIIDSNGDVLVDWHIAYDYTDENPQMLGALDGVVDEEGNLYIVYRAGYLEPVYGYFPTFGWFDHSYLGLDGQVQPLPPEPEMFLSVNPVLGGVQFFLEGIESTTLRVFDLAGREVAAVNVSEGSGFWDGTGFSGSRLPAGIYTVVGEQGLSMRLTLLQE